jgi:hypothetical protein
VSRSNYEHEWGKNFQKPSAGERFLAFLYTLLPKFGPLKVLQFKTPTPQTEQMFEASFNATLDRYRKLLQDVMAGPVELRNDNFDLGEVTGPGKYGLNDDAHAELLDKLAQRNFAGASPEIRAELLEFYADLNAPNATKRKPKVWSKVQVQLQQLKAAAPAPVTAAASPGQHIAAEDLLVAIAP